FSKTLTNINELASLVPFALSLLSLVLPLCLHRVAFAATPPHCGHRPVAFPGTIIRGQSSWPGQFPWHAALYRLERTQATASYVCGCFIVGNRALLTAAHCVTDASGFQLAASELTIRAGLHDLLALARHSQEHRVQRIVRHGNYSLGSPRHDVALLTLRTVVEFGEFVQPICLPSAGTHAPGSGIVAGWGLTEDDELARTLRASAMPVVDLLRCLRSDPELFGQVLYDGMFCAGWQNGTNVCNGDSGGAFVATVNGSWTAFGIVSFTGLREEASAGHPFRCDTRSLAGFVSVPKYRRWIESVAEGERVILSTSVDDVSSISEGLRHASASHELPQGYSRLVIDCFAVLISDRFLLAPASCSEASNKAAAPAKQFIILEAAGHAVDYAIRTFHQHPDFVNNPPGAGDRDPPDQVNLALIQLERAVRLSTCQFVCLWAGADSDLGQIVLYSAVNGSGGQLESECYDKLLAPMVMLREPTATGGEEVYRLVGIVLHRTCTKLRFIKVAPFLSWIEQIVWG
uniref:Peptidase S1 domain-containing protein n=1 Tax=Anopheles atroparvus TaxID=41427 RepID=A0AAG5DTL3_ANOAO